MKNQKNFSNNEWNTESLTGIIDNISDGCQLVDFDYRYRYLNKSAIKHSRQSKEALIGRTMMESYPGIEKTEMFSFLKDTMENRRAHTLVNQFKFPDGKEGWFELRMEPVDPGVFIISIDITERKKAEDSIKFRNKRLEKQNKELARAKTEFVAIASHQLRTPLGIEKWYLEVIQRDKYIKKAPKSIKKYLSEIAKTNETVLGLVNDLLSLSRIDQGKVHNDPSMVSPANIVKEVVKKMNVLASKNRITIKTNDSNNIPQIFIDPNRFRDVIENLLSNAINYNIPGGKVDVSIKKIGKNILIAVKDTGIGIEREEIKHISTKFYRTKKATMANPGGTGLGLYIVKSYVSGWGGKVTIKSKVGKGSTFIVSLPIKKQ